MAGVVVASSPDVILVNDSPTALAFMALTKTVPIVAYGGDPLAIGLVSNLAHPGSNVTAIASGASPDAEAKNLDLLAEAVPNAKHVAYYGPGVGGKPDIGTIGYVQSAAAAAMKLGLVFTDIVVENPADEAEYRRAFAAAVATMPDIIQIGTGTVTNNGSALLARLALDARIPTISPYGPFAEAGGLLSYGVNSPENFRQAARYLALILNGAKAGDLPVLQPTVFDFVINLKTAKAIGVTIPESLLVQATEVVQ